MVDDGFTDHEHLDDAQLIHMNGRVYDYNLGRFVSVDPFIQAPGNSQSLNPYSYIMNNPLAGTDPSGYIADCFLSITCKGDNPENPFHYPETCPFCVSTGEASGNNGAEKEDSQTGISNDASENIGAPAELIDGTNRNSDLSHIESLQEVPLPDGWTPQYLTLVEGLDMTSLTENDLKIMFLIEKGLDAHVDAVKTALDDQTISDDFRAKLTDGLENFNSAKLIYNNKDAYPKLASAGIRSDGSNATITFFRSAADAMGINGEPVKGYGVELRTGFSGIKDLVNHEVGHLVLKNTFVTHQDVVQ